MPYKVKIVTILGKVLLLDYKILVCVYIMRYPEFAFASFTVMCMCVCKCVNCKNAAFFRIQIL